MQPFLFAIWFLLEKDYIQVDVEDTGIGIDPEDHEKIIQEFSQLESPHTKQYEGTGLGLTLNKRLVELHGGCIWMRSKKSNNKS